MNTVIVVYSMCFIFKHACAGYEDLTPMINLTLNNVRIESYGFLNVSSSDVTFRLWTRDQIESNASYVQLKIGDVKNVSSLRPTKPFKFIIHGYLSSADADWYKNMTRELLIKNDYNVVQVDWSRPASSAYPLAASYTKSVGSYVAKLIADLYISYGIPTGNVHMIGHSLGAHTCGYVGMFVNETLRTKIGRITGMDPAGPLFVLADADDKLDRTDAVFVDIIHTDRGKYGYAGELGHADFYPDNGIAPQPLCETFANIFDEAVGCSHSCSILYFIESINHNDFIGMRCTNYFYFVLDYCPDTNLKAAMGLGCSPRTRGSYYLSVNPESPYGQGNVFSSPDYDY